MVLEHTLEDGEVILVQAGLLTLLARYRSYFACHDDAYANMVSAYRLQERILEEVDPLVLETKTGIGDIQKLKGRYADTEAIYHEVHSLRLSMPGKGEVLAIKSLNAIAGAL